MKIEVQIVHAFVDGNNGGNPAGIVTDANHLSNKEKQQIAAKVGLSETAFVSNSDMADFKLEFFTPNRQIPHCGHATIAAFSLLHQSGRLKSNFASKETIDGLRAIMVENENVFMEQQAPKFFDAGWLKKRILASLNLTKNGLMENAPLQVVNTGVSFLIVPVRNSEVLKSLEPAQDLINELSDELDLVGFYVFSTETEKNGRDAGARMFAPRYGITEESATGMAAGPLATYIYDILKIKKPRFFIEQGHWMNPSSPSLIRVDLTIKNDKIIGLMAGGKGTLVGEKIIHLEQKTKPTPVL